MNKKIAKKGKKVLTGMGFAISFGIALLCPSQSISEQDNTVLYAHAAQTPALDLTQAYAFPVPYKPAAGQGGITFINLSTEATIRIYTLDGQLVKTLLETDGDGILKWTGTNEEGSPLASDVYVYSIENGEQIKLGKLLLIQ